MLVPAIETLYHRIVDPRFVIRRVCLSCNNVAEDRGALQRSMFEDCWIVNRCYFLNRVTKEKDNTYFICFCVFAVVLDETIEI